MYAKGMISKGCDEQLGLQVQAAVPYILLGGEPFWGRKEVKDVMAYLRLLANLHDDAALTRIINTPKRAIGDKAVANLTSWAE